MLSAVEELQLLLGPDVVLLRSRIIKVGWWFSKQTGPHLRSGQISAASDLPSESAQRWSDAWHFGLHCSQRWGWGRGWAITADGSGMACEPCRGPPSPTWLRVVGLPAF
jgi:hypothetical protein